jgi:hypothetical protein
MKAIPSCQQKFCLTCPRRKPPHTFSRGSSPLPSRCTVSVITHKRGCPLLRGPALHCPAAHVQAARCRAPPSSRTRAMLPQMSACGEVWFRSRPLRLGLSCTAIEVTRESETNGFPRHSQAPFVYFPSYYSVIAPTVLPLYLCCKATVRLTPPILAVLYALGGDQLLCPLRIRTLQGWIVLICIHVIFITCCVVHLMQC